MRFCGLVDRQISSNGFLGGPSALILSLGLPCALLLGRFEIAVPLTFRVEFYTVEQLNVTHEACHNEATLRPIQYLGDLRDRRLLLDQLLDFVFVNLIKLVYQHVVVKLLLRLIES